MGQKTNKRIANAKYYKKNKVKIKKKRKKRYYKNIEKEKASSKARYYKNRVKDNKEEAKEAI